MIPLIGRTYDPSIESDILLLDISNNDEYIWTSDFKPSVTGNLPSSPSPSSPSSSSPSSPLMPSSTQAAQPALVGAIIGSLIGGILLAFGSSFLYKWYKNKQIQKNIIQVPGNQDQRV